ncbi:MAG: nitroreductase family protein [Commensalibacter sp.]|nr:nitroreductase family protein [Commensalibacter sp.]
MTEKNSVRVADYPIHDLFLKRSSTRYFSEESMSKEALLTLLEAGRWAASAYNNQPWVFIYVLRNSPNWKKYLELLFPSNRQWAEKAAALVFVASRKQAPEGKEVILLEHYSHSFDTGMATAHIMLQAANDGWSAHPMIGFDMHGLREITGIPKNYRMEIALAIGRPLNPSDIANNEEKPSLRLPLSEVAFEEKFEEKE